VESLDDTDNETVTVLALASFGVNVTDTNLPVGENEVVEVEVNVTNEGDLQGNETGGLVVGGQVKDSATLELNSSESTSITLKWQTELGDGGNSSISVTGASDTEIISVEIDELLDRREVGRGEENLRRERSRDLGRGENSEHDDLRRDSGRNRCTNRRDRGR